MLACLFAPLPARPDGQSGAVSFEAQLAQGIKLLGEGRLPESITALNGAKQSAPQDARPYFYCGMALAQAGRLRDAAGELGEAIHLAPEQLDYRVFQAHVLEQLKQAAAAQDALVVFQKEPAVEQLSPAWLQLLADVYYRLGINDRALKILDLWALRDPSDARIDLFRGQAYLADGKPDMALSCFQRSLQKSTQNPLAYFELGALFYERNQLAEAKEALLNAVREDAKNPEYLSKLASVYLAMRNPDSAIESLKRVEEAGPKLPMIYYNLGRAYRSKGEPALAAAYMEKFQQATSADKERQARTLEVERPIGQAQRQLDQGNTEAARALFEKALEVDPNRWEPHANLAEMYLNSGDLNSAYPHLQKLEQIDPESAIGNFLIAKYWFKRNECERAQFYAEKVKVSRPDNSELRVLLGDIYMQLGQRLKAVEEYQQAARLAPGRADFRERLRLAAGDNPPDASLKP